MRAHRHHDINLYPDLHFTLSISIIVLKLAAPHFAVRRITRIKSTFLFSTIIFYQSVNSSFSKMVTFLNGTLDHGLPSMSYRLCGRVSATPSSVGRLFFCFFATASFGRLLL